MYNQERKIGLRTERMILLREKARMTQLMLAVRIGITQEAISGYESGKFQPSLKNLVAIARELNSTIDYLLGIGDTITDYSAAPSHVATFARESEQLSDDESMAHLKISSLLKKMTPEQKEKTIIYMQELLNPENL